jgi:DNA polymerase III alpha subunit
MAARRNSRAGSFMVRGDGGPGDGGGLMARFAELCAASNFSFLRGASHPHEMVEAAAALGLEAVAIADRNTLAGAVRAFLAGREQGVRVLTAARLVAQTGVELVCIPRTRAAYGRLCRALSDAHETGEPGAPHIDLPAMAQALGEAQILILMPPPEADEDWRAQAQTVLARAVSPVHLALVRRFDGRDGARLHGLAALARAWGVPTVASSDALYHAPERRALQDVLTCIREHVRIDGAGRRLEANAERHLKDAAEMARLFADYSDAVTRTAQLAGTVSFSLDELVYAYPDETIGAGETPMETLRRLTREGAARRWPGGVPGSGAKGARSRAGADRIARLRQLFPDRGGSGAVRPLAGHSVSGARLGGQFSRVLRDWRHRSGPGADRSSV